jgi:hypothetical protein
VATQKVVGFRELDCFVPRNDRVFFTRIEVVMRKGVSSVQPGQGRKALFWEDLAEKTDT